MSAKSVSDQFQGLSSSQLASWARSIVTVFVLVASVSALWLIVEKQYGPHFLGDTYSRIRSLNQGEPAAAGMPNTAAHPADESHAALAKFLAKRYKVSQEATRDLVSIAYAAGRQIGLDPLLIIAVISVESGFNPIAESVAGAKGLMQIIPKYHTDKIDALGGVSEIFNPQINILVGSSILKEYLRRTGNVSVALQMYAGALEDEQDVYTNKVMNEKKRLQYIVGHAVRALRVNRQTAMQSDALLSPL